MPNSYSNVEISQRAARAVRAPRNREAILARAYEPALHIQIPALHKPRPVLDEGEAEFGLAAHEAFDGFGGLALLAGRVGGLGLDQPWAGR